MASAVNGDGSPFFVPLVPVAKQAELAASVAELIRKVGITEQMFYRWKKQYKGLEIGSSARARAAARGEHAPQAVGGGPDLG